MKNKTISSFTLAVLWMMGASAQAASQSQTLLRIDNGGLIQTLPASSVDEYNIFTAGVKDPLKVKNAALLYDKRNPLPPLTILGGNYAFFSGGVMATVSEDGSFYYKGKISIEPGSIGGNYFLNKANNEVIAIDSSGFFNFTGTIANNVRLLGGNFYVSQSGILTTIKHMGSAPGNPLGMLTIKEGWDFCDAILAGGNFLVKVDGSIVGINSESGFFTEPQKVSSRPRKIGGNYFISDDNTLYTVNNKGEVNKQMPIIGQMKNFGYSYMVDADGDFIFVDSNGTPHTEMVRVSSTGIKSILTNKIKGLMTNHQSFIRAQQ